MPKTRQRDVTTPHFRLPFQFSGSGKVMMNEQDTPEDIIDCVKAIIAYPVGSRQNMKSFGIPDLLFKQTGSEIPQQIRNAISIWEERASYEVGGGPSISDELLHEILIKVVTRDG